MSAKSYYLAVSCLSEPLSGLLMGVPESFAGQVREIRLRVGKPIHLLTAAGYYLLDSNGQPVRRIPDHPIITQRMLEDCLLVICGYSLHTYQQNIAQGFVTLRGGHRAGLAGSCVWENGIPKGIRELSSICIRIAREVPGCASALAKAVLSSSGGLLIAGTPGSGKTTLLRDLARILADSFHNVAVLDERGEIAAVSDGVPQLDTGFCSDILSGYSKGTGIDMAVRTLSPEYIICDELGGQKDIEIFRQSVCRGVRMIATVHAKDHAELLKREGLRELLESGVFSKIAYLDSSASPGKIVKMISLDEDTGQ